jgi:tetratricopeptide (TPR) repeat protein
LLRADDFFKERGYLHDLLTLRDLSSGSTSAFPAWGNETTSALDDEEDDFDAIDDEEDEFDVVDDDDYDDENLEDVDEAQVNTFRQSLLQADDDDDEDEALPSTPVARPLPLEPVINAPLGNDPEQLRAALNQARQNRDLTRQAQILTTLGKALVAQDKTSEAITTYNDLVTVQETLGENDGLLDTLDMLSSLLVKTGSSQAAILHATRGAQLASERGQVEPRINMLLTLGDARQDLGESDNAVKAFSQALELSRNNDDMQHEALALYKLGYAHLDSGAPDQAIHTWEQAREMFKSQFKRDYEGRVLGGLGTAYAEQGRWTEAMGYYKSALYIAREVSDPEEESIQLSNLGQAQVEAGQLPEALLSYRQALHLAYQSDDRDNIVSAIVDLVRLMMRSNRLLGICQLLIQDAENLEPNDRDVVALSTQIEDKLADAGARGVVQTPVNGTARDYAANAYALLEG